MAYNSHSHPWAVKKNLAQLIIFDVNTLYMRWVFFHAFIDGC